jgi:fructose 1,6-bisphosphatase
MGTDAIRALGSSLVMWTVPGRSGRTPKPPGRLPMEDMEYTTMPQVAERMHECWEPVGQPAPTPG